MKKRVLIGLTGGIASGKSVVLREFRRLGARTLDCDIIARDAVKPGRPALRQIYRKFGKSVFKKGGSSSASLDRKALGKIVFASAQKRKELEKIVHPQVVRVLKKKISTLRSGIMVIDIPLLFEVHLEKLVDYTLVVWAPRKIQFSRLLARNSMGRKEALNRLASQWPLSKKRKLADFTLNNSGSRKGLKLRVKKLMKRFRN